MPRLRTGPCSPKQYLNYAYVSLSATTIPILLQERKARGRGLIRAECNPPSTRSRPDRIGASVYFQRGEEGRHDGPSCPSPIAHRLFQRIGKRDVPLLSPRLNLRLERVLPGNRHVDVRADMLEPM